MTQYVKEKYGEDRVISVGTYSRMHAASAAKDLLRIYKVDFKKSNSFTSKLDSSLGWEDNLENIRVNFPNAYKIYEEYKEVLDLVPKFINKLRQVGAHAGGVVVLDRPVYEIIPIERVTGRLVSSYPESAQEQVLDELGVIKFDILGLSTLDIISSTVEMIDEELYLIEDDDGIEKIVPESYIDKTIESF